MFGSASPESTNSALLAFRLIMKTIIKNFLYIRIDNRGLIEEKNPEIQVPFSGQSFSNHPSSLWRIGAICLRSTTRNMEHRKPGIGSLKAEKISTEDSSTWLATNLLAFILIPKQRNIRMLFSTPGQPHGGADSFQGDGHCHQVCCAPQVLKSVKASLLKNN